MDVQCIREQKGKSGKWIFNKLASKPVFINTVNPEVRTKVAYNLLREYGYFNGATSYEVEPDPKNPKKAKISYKVEMNNAYTYDSIAYVRLRHRIDTLVQRNIGDRLLRDGDNFNVVQLEAERNAYLPYSVTTGITISVPNLSATRPIRS